MSIVEYDYEFRKKIPYCSVCAVKAIDKALESLKEKIMTAKRNGKSYFESGDAKNKTICQSLGLDLTKFAGFNLYAETDDSEVMETTNVNNIRTRIKVGTWKNLICKTCNSNKAFKILDGDSSINESLEGESTKDGIPKKQ